MEETKKCYVSELPDKQLPWHVSLGDPIQGELLAAFLNHEDAKLFCIDKNIEWVENAIKVAAEVQKKLKELI